MTEDNYILEKLQYEDTRQFGFKLLVEKYQTKVYWQIRRMVIDHDDADDLTQDTFIKVWKNIETFRQESNIYTWIYRIATNETINFLNKKRKRFFISIHDVEQDLSNKLTSDHNLDADETERKFQKALLTLPEKQRIVFNMRYYDEVPYEEMSRILSTSEGALKASYHHAAKKIKECIENDEDNEDYK